MLKTALEIALEKHEHHERLSAVTAELLEHVALLEEGWIAIRPPAVRAVSTRPRDEDVREARAA